MRSDSNDWQMLAGQFLMLSNNGGGLQSVHFGHLDVHQGDIDSCPVGLLQNIKCLAPIAGTQDGMATFFKQAFDQ